LGGKGLLYYLPLTLAERLGYFKEQGLTVTINDFGAGPKSLQALVGGSVDVGDRRLRAHHPHAGERPKHQGRDPSSAGSRHRARGQEGSGGQRQVVQGLKGFKIGVTAPGSSTNFFVNALIAKDGLKPEDVSIIGVGASMSAVAAMKKGDIMRSRTSIPSSPSWSRTAT